MHSEKCILQGTDIVTAVIHIQKWMIITKRWLLCGLCCFKLHTHCCNGSPCVHSLPTLWQRNRILATSLRFSYTGTKTRRTLLNRVLTHLWVSFVSYESENSPSSPVPKSTIAPPLSLLCLISVWFYFPSSWSSIHLSPIKDSFFPRLSDWRSWAKGRKKWALMGGSRCSANCPVNVLFAFIV